MTEPFVTQKASERCLVVHPHISAEQTGNSRAPSALLEEAVGLTQAIHLDVAEARSFIVKRRTPRTLIGPGQVAECKSLAHANDIAVVILNTQLSPTQQRNLEKAIGTKVIDRTALILEIFGERAQTAEGKLQVELAALNYQKSRLVRSWTHLERQRGGHGFMGGPGESQIETDRRLIAERIIVIKKQLEKVKRTRELHRKTRRDTPFPLVALVGYTNAGKSTLFNRLTNARVVAEDMLFATLDPTIRALTLPSGQKIMMSDTVGFISDLPHELIAAFRATLEEVLEADLILHVRDISHSETDTQAADVHEVLRDLLGNDALEALPQLEVWNKIDLISAELMPDNAQRTERILAASAITGAGCDALLEAIDQQLQSSLYVKKCYQLSAADGRALAWLHAHGDIQEQQLIDNRYEISVLLRPADANRFEQQFIS